MMCILGFLEVLVGVVADQWRAAESLGSKFGLSHNFRPSTMPHTSQPKANKKSGMTEYRKRQAVNIATVQCPVGRIRVSTRWDIIDLDYRCASTTFLDGNDFVDDEDV